MAPVDGVVRKLSESKTQFLNSVENAIAARIRREGSNCIALVTKYPGEDGSVVRRWEPGANDELHHYCKVLWKFTQEEKYHGYQVDSALTKPIYEIVETKYKEFFEEHKDEIGEQFLQEILSNDLLLNSMLGRVVEEILKKGSKQVQKEVVKQIVSQLHDSIAHGVLHNVGHQISVMTSTAAGAQIAATLAQLLLKHFAVQIATAISHFIASTAFHKLIAILAKKLIIGAVSSAVLSFLGTHVAAAAGGGMIGWIALPLVAAYIVYKCATFPEDLAKKVSKSVREELARKFDPWNRSLTEKVWDNIFNGEEIVKRFAENKEVQRGLVDIAATHGIYLSL